jgi:hypothetical protein
LTSITLKKVTHRNVYNDYPPPARYVHTMIEQSMVHLPELLKDIARPVSIYLVYLSRLSWTKLSRPVLRSLCLGGMGRPIVPSTRMLLIVPRFCDKEPVTLDQGK